MPQILTFLSKKNIPIAYHSKLEMSMLCLTGLWLDKRTHFLPWISMMTGAANPRGEIISLVNFNVFLFDPVCYFLRLFILINYCLVPLWRKGCRQRDIDNGESHRRLPVVRNWEIKQCSRAGWETGGLSSIWSMWRWNSSSGHNYLLIARV